MWQSYKKKILRDFKDKGMKHTTSTDMRQAQWNVPDAYLHSIYCELVKTIQKLLYMHIEEFNFLKSKWSSLDDDFLTKREKEKLHKTKWYCSAKVHWHQVEYDVPLRQQKININKKHILALTASLQACFCYR